ncbi:MAG: T9SS type A sorting domain-containing protein [Bacteroidales bacterium]|nr:T9SS type A sorting domain-containing protein [Bacteroidales bacterium]MCF8403546.1 T9SS type A sorting domain-containing protein [Bacteroidales bacterium]
MKTFRISSILILVILSSIYEGVGQSVNKYLTEPDILFNKFCYSYTSYPHLQIFDYWDKTGQWVEIGPTSSSDSPTKDVGRLSTLCIDPENDSIILVGSPSGGLYYTVNKGESWINAGLDRPKEEHDLNIFTPGIASILILHKDNKTYWIVATGDKDQNFNYSRGVIRSTNQGESWELINGMFPQNLPDNWYYIRKLSNHPVNHNVTYAATSRGLYRSENILDEIPENVSWSLLLEDPISNGEGFFDLEFHVSKPDTIFLSREYRNLTTSVKGNEILWSLDGGNEWQPIPGSASFLPKDSIYNHFLSIFEMSPANDDVLYIYMKGRRLTEPRYYHHHCKYIISENKWIELSPVLKLTGNGRNGYAVSPVNEKLLYCATVQTYLSQDGGISWQKENDTLLRNGILKTNPHVDVQELKINKAGTEIWAATDGGPYMKEISDTIWQNKINNIGIAKVMKFDQSQKHPEYYLFGGWDVGSQVFNKEENLWDQVGPGDGFGCAFDNVESGTFYTANYPGYSLVVRNKNYSDSSQYRVGNFWTANVAVSPNDHNTVYVSLGNFIKRSTDQGKNWHILVSPEDLGLDPANYFIYDMHTAENNGNYLYLRVFPVNQGEHPFIFRSGNIHAPYNFIKWEDITPNPAPVGWLSDLEVDAIDQNRIWITYGSLITSKVLEYNGSHWVDISGNLQDLNSGVHSIAHLKGTQDGLFAGTSYGIYYLEDRSKDWVLYKPGLPNVVPIDIKINYAANTILTGLDGRGLWETELPENYLVPDIPEENTTLQIYPNPGDDYILIEYNLDPGEEKVKVDVYNVEGKICETQRIVTYEGILLFNTQQWKKGIYVAVLSYKEVPKTSIKFVLK